MANDFTTGFSDMVNPQQPQVDVQQFIRPPASPEEYQQRLSGWSDFGKAVRENPTLQMTLMRFAANMLQGKQPGQSTASAVAEGAFDALEYGGRAIAGQAKTKREQEQHQAELGRTQAATASSQAQTAATKQQTEFAAQKQPLVMQNEETRLAAERLQLAEAQYNAAVRDQLPAKERAIAERELRAAKLAHEKASANLQNQQARLAGSQASAVDEGRTKSGGLPGGKGGPDIRKNVMRIPIGQNMVELRTMNPDQTYSSEFEQIIPAMTGFDAVQQAAMEVQSLGIDPRSAEGKKAVAQKVTELAQPKIRRYRQDPQTGALVPVEQPATATPAVAAKDGQKVWNAKTKQWEQ